MDISKRGIDLILASEGKKKKLPDGRYKSYLDTLAKPPVWTVYCGLTKGVTKDTVVSVDEGERMFAKELAVYEDAVERLVKVPLNQNQFDALVSFTYNCGPGALEGSTLLVVLNQGKYGQVPAQLMRWTHAGGVEYAGLVTRRKAEGALFMEPVTAAEPVEIADGDDIPAATAIPQRVEESTVPVTTAVRQSPTLQSAIGVIFSGLASGYTWLVSGAAETSTEATKLKTSFSGFDALWAAAGLNVGLVLAGFVVIGGSVVLVRHLNLYREGRV